MSAPIVAIATAGAELLSFTPFTSNPLLAAVPVGMWAKASISLPSQLARGAEKRSRSATPIVHISTGLPRRLCEREVGRGAVDLGLALRDPTLMRASSAAAALSASESRSSATSSGLSITSKLARPRRSGRARPVSLRGDRRPGRQCRSGCFALLPERAAARGVPDTRSPIRLSRSRLRC